ncbi:MAG: hypothetical protein JOZ70_01030 [Pseudolabrys sp.]|nr:hypothetical protein [Pseudolabrys sp.]
MTVLVFAFGTLAFTSILSQTVVLRTIYPAFKQGFTGPGISLVTEKYADMGRLVGAALNQCGLKPNAPRLMADDYTYPFLRYSRRVIPATYAYFAGPVEGVQLARQKQSSGLVTRCEFVPNNVPGLSLIRVGKLCCANFGAGPGR